MVRFIIRPANILSTPKLLKETLGAKKTRKYPEDRPRFRAYNFDTDLFLIYPPPSLVETEKKDVYHSLYQFYSSTKPVQRGLLEQCGIKTIPFATRKDDARDNLPGKRFVNEDIYIVRPYRHSGGQNYKVTVSPEDFIEGKEYISVFFPKQREYRIIFCKGKPIITLRKRVPEGVDNVAPWNHATGSVFVTVEREENNHLLKTSCLDDLAKSPIIQNTHIVGVDVLLNKKSKDYAVLELNTCPAITLEHNLEKVKEIVQAA